MSTLEDRLTLALAARADAVAPEDLTPGSPPATVVPLRARFRPSVYAVLAAAAAAAVVVVVTIGGGAPTQPEPLPQPTPTPTPAPDGLPALYPARDWPGGDALRLDPGESAPGFNGTTLSLSTTRLTLTGLGGDEVHAELSGAAEPRAYAGWLSIGDLGTVYLVSESAGDGDTWSLFQNASTALVPVAVNGRDGFALGTGIGPVEADPDGSFQSWISEQGVLYTRVGLGGERFAVYRWDFDGAGIGPFAVGVVCIDDTTTPPTYERC